MALSVTRMFCYSCLHNKVCLQVFYTDKPIVLCAPTGSGKTVAFELAIVRLLIQNSAVNRKIIYSNLQLWLLTGFVHLLT